MSVLLYRTPRFCIWEDCLKDSVSALYPIRFVIEDFLPAYFLQRSSVFQNSGTSAVVSVRGKKETKDQVGFQYCGAKVNHD